MKQHQSIFLICFVSLAFISSSVPVTAQSIYRWTDAQGRVHFSNAPVAEAIAVDDELPPATSFGGVPGSLPPSLQISPPTEQQPDAPPSTAAFTPDQGGTEEELTPTNREETTTTDQEQVSIPEEIVESANGQSLAQENIVELLPRPFADLSEREETDIQTVASENPSPSLLDEDLDQPDPETKNLEEDDSDASEDSEDTNDDGDEETDDYEPEGAEEEDF